MRGWAGFGLLCVWSASQWLIPTAAGSMPGAERGGLAFAAVAVGAAFFLKSWQLSLQQSAVTVAASLMFFAAPDLLLERASESMPETGIAAVFAAAPAVAVVVCGAIQRGAGGMRLLVPALVGWSGVLFLLPFESPVSTRGWMGLAETIAAMMLAAGAGVWLNGLLRGVRVVEALVIVGAANAVALLAWCAARGMLWLGVSELAGGAWWGLVGSACAIGITVWLVKVVEPVKFSVRFLVFPLLTVLEGIGLLRPELTMQMVAGTVLLVAGAGWMLAQKELSSDEVLTLR